MKGNALGDRSTVTYIEQQLVQHPAPEPQSWPVLVGAVPQLASAFQPHRHLRNRVDDARQAGGAMVLTQVLSGGGGVGKTQLAAAYAAEALSGSTDLDETQRWSPQHQRGRSVSDTVLGKPMRRQGPSFDRMLRAVR